jgi:proteasome accessory factor A
MTDRVEVPNVYGIETEYSAMMTFPGDKIYEIVGKCHSENEELGLYAEPKQMGGSHIPPDSLVSTFADMGLTMTSVGMLSNGGRFYIDPSGPEYDTPETTSAEEAVHRSFDGDDLVLGMLSRLREDEVLQGFQLNRRLVDHTRTSRGVHLNTTTSFPAEDPSNLVMKSLMTLNVAKGSMFGSGGILLDAFGQTEFHHSPRLSITSDEGANYVNYTKRPLVRYPFKPDGKRLARIESVTSDALNFGWPLKASLIATNSVIRVLELGLEPEFPDLMFPVEAAQIVGQYGPDSSIDIVRSDGSISLEKPQNILAQMCETMLEIDITEDYLDVESRQVLYEIIEVADRMNDDIWSVANQVESIARLLAMQKKMDQRQVELDSEIMCRFDYAWDWLGGGIAETLRNSNKVGWQGFKTKHSPRTAAKRRLTPPSDTRAKIRGDIIAESGGKVQIDWMKMGLKYLHPYDTTL